MLYHHLIRDFFYNVPTAKNTNNTFNRSTLLQSRPTGIPRLQPYTYASPSKHQIARQLVTQHLQEKMNHIFNDMGKKMSLDELLHSSMANVWEIAVSNELGRLAQGINNIKGNDVIDFIYKHEVPKNKIVTYARMVCDYRPLKDEKYRLRLTVGGDRLYYEDDAASPAASLLETKILLNSTISQSAKGCRFMTLDIKDFFLKTAMTEYEYMCIHNKYFIGAIREKYNINNIMAADGFVYCKIKKGMYGLKQAARLAYDDLKQHLLKYGYSPDPIAHNIWSHTSRKTKFCLCVDDFGVQYFSERDAQHLISALRDKYDITVDKKGTHFCGLNLAWNYTHGYVDISMKDYVKKTLNKLNYKCTTSRQLAPHKWTIPTYTKDRQFPQPQDTSALIDKKGIKYVQRTIGSFLYYGRAVDNTILTALNDISLSQAKPTENTIKKIQMLLDYLNTYPNARIRYYASDMQLHIDSDAAYLIAPKAKSRISGFYYLSDTPKQIGIQPKLNGPIHVECRLLQHVVTSASEAETAALFYNAQTALYLQNILQALGHKQNVIPLKTDNATAAAFVTDTLKHKRSKSWDVRYHWLSEQQKKGIFRTFWDKGKHNLADYHSKHHPPSHHQNMRKYYILKNFLINMTKKWSHQNNKVRKCLHARVCS